MATLREMETMADALIASDFYIIIEGLDDYEAVIKNFIEKKFAYQIDMFDNPTSELFVGNLTAYYMGDGKPDMEVKISNIKILASSLRQQSAILLSVIESAQAAMIVPSVTVTEQSVAINGSWLTKSKEGLQQLSMQLYKPLPQQAIDLLQSAIALYFELPENVIEDITKLSEIKVQIDNITL